MPYRKEEHSGQSRVFVCPLSFKYHSMGFEGLDSFVIKVSTT